MTDHESGKLVSDMDYVKQTLDKLANDMKTYIIGQDGRQNSRDKECAVHSKEIAVLQTDVSNQRHDIEILFTNQKDIKSNIESTNKGIADLDKSMSDKTGSIYRWVIGSVLVAILSIGAAIYAAASALIGGK